MNRSFKPALLAAVATTFLCLTLPTQAQQGPGGGGGGRRGNFDPEEMRQRMMDGYKDALEVKGEDEWKVIQPRIQKILDARREVGFGGGMGRMMFGRGRGGDNQGGGADRQGGGRRGFGGQQSAAATELEKAIESKASAETIKAKLEAYREDRQKKQANLEKAQEDLKKVLTLKQEASAVLAGLLE